MVSIEKFLCIWLPTKSIEQFFVRLFRLFDGWGWWAGKKYVILELKNCHFAEAIFLATSCWYMIDFTRDIRVWMKIINGISLIEFSPTRSQWLHSSFSSNWYSMLFHARNSTEIETTLENETPHHSDIYATLAPCIPPYLSFYEEKLHLNHHCSS